MFSQRDTEQAPNTHPLVLALPNNMGHGVSASLQIAGDTKVGLATPESFTDGALAPLLTNIGGFNQAFDRRFISYNNNIKCDLCGSRRIVIYTSCAGGEPGLAHSACSAHGIETHHSVWHFGDIRRGSMRVERRRFALDIVPALPDHHLVRPERASRAAT
jgi:nicotinamide-nucleotide amidase